jgi:hypothetical protein
MAHQATKRRDHRRLGIASKFGTNSPTRRHEQFHKCASDHQRCDYRRLSDFFFPLFFAFKKGCNPLHRFCDCAKTQPSPVISSFSSTFLSSFLQVKERLYFHLAFYIGTLRPLHRHHFALFSRKLLNTSTIFLSLVR